MEKSSSRLSACRLNNGKEFTHPVILAAEAPVKIPEGALFTVSARGKMPWTPILEYLTGEFGHIGLSRIESVFGFAEACTLYGGRPFVQAEISARDAFTLHHCCIGLRLPLSNHHVSRKEYDQYGPFLEKHHREGNSIIACSNHLARWLRRDFPKYEIEASVIKGIDTHEKIARALEIFDTVVLPMKANLDSELLGKIEQKHRVTLFANAGCALNCPAKVCYPSFSRVNKFTGAEISCSLSDKPRALYGMLNFDLEKLAAFGFTRFKLLRMREHGLTGF